MTRARGRDLGVGFWAGGGPGGIAEPPSPRLLVFPFSTPTLAPSPGSPARALAVCCATQQLQALSHGGGGSKMRWKTRPPLVFLFYLQGLPPLQALGAHCLLRDPKKRWVWEGQFVHCLRVPRWGEGVCFLSGEPLGRRGNSSAATLCGPLTLHYLSLSCDLDSAWSCCRREHFSGKGWGACLSYPFPFEQCRGEASLLPGLHTPFSLSDCPVFFLISFS